MKKILCVFVVLAFVLCGALSIGATEETTSPVTEIITEATTELDTEAVTEAVTELDTEAPYIEDEITTEPVTEWEIPDEDEVRKDVTSWIDRLSATFGGMQFWEDAKAWILDNLDMIVGGIMAVITAIVGLATRFRWIPKLMNAWTALKVAIGKWYDENSKSLAAFAVAVDALKGQLQELILHEVKPIVEKVEKQSAEVERLEAENNELRRDYILSRERADRIEGALLEYSKLAAEEFYHLIQQSDLTKEELNRHYDAYHAKLELIESATLVGRAEGGDAA